MHRSISEVVAHTGVAIDESRQQLTRVIDHMAEMRGRIAATRGDIEASMYAMAVLERAYRGADRLAGLAVDRERPAVGRSRPRR